MGIKLLVISRDIRKSILRELLISDLGLRDQARSISRNSVVVAEGEIEVLEPEIVIVDHSLNDNGQLDAIEIAKAYGHLLKVIAICHEEDIHHYQSMELENIRPGEVSIKIQEIFGI